VTTAEAVRLPVKIQSTLPKRSGVFPKRNCPVADWTMTSDILTVHDDRGTIKLMGRIPCGGVPVATCRRTHLGRLVSAEALLAALAEDRTA
jgi:hypothetical protein